MVKTGEGLGVSAAGTLEARKRLVKMNTEVRMG
jgi:hypothetical protein